MTVNIYGLSRCKQTQKAIAWLNERNLSFEFHNFDKTGINLEKLTKWSQEVDYRQFLNTKNPSYKKLPEEVIAGLNTVQNALELMRQHPHLIKRPVLETENILLFGFDQERYKSIFKQVAPLSVKH
jgi:arsenate reductase